MRINSVKITSDVPDIIYFSDLGRIGSTQYGAYCQSPGTLACDMLKEDDEEVGRALIFGKLLHGMLDGSLNLDEYTIGKTKTTTALTLKKNEIGSSDAFVLRTMLSNFPIDINKIRDGCELFEQEKGYFLDFEMEDGQTIKVRCKADLLFKVPFSDEIEIIDFKTASSFQNGKFDEKYQFQAELYAFCSHFIHSAEMVTPTTYYFMKEAPYRQYDIVRPKIKINEDFINMIVLNLIGATDVMIDPVPYLKYNVSLNNETLKCFTR